MRKNLLSFFDDWLAHGWQTAFAHRRGLRAARWSYTRLRTTALQFARELEARNISKGDRVLICAQNSPEWVAAFFGCLLRGVVVVPLDFESSSDFAARVQQQVGRQLEQQRAKLRSQRCRGLEELTNRISAVAQPSIVRNAPGRFQRQPESLRRRLVPAVENLLVGRTVEGVVDLDSRKPPGVVRQHLRCGKFLGIEAASPLR